MDNTEIEMTLIVMKDKLRESIHELAHKHQVDGDLLDSLMLVQYNMNKCVLHLSQNNTENEESRR